MSRPLDPVLEELLRAVPPPRTDAQRRARAGRPRPPSTRRQKCTFAISADLARRFRRLCQAEGVDQRAVVEQLIEGWLAQHGHRTR